MAQAISIMLPGKNKTKNKMLFCFVTQLLRISVLSSELKLSQIFCYQLKRRPNAYAQS